MTTGLIVCLLALAVAAGSGAVWRARNGRLRDPRGAAAATRDPGQPQAARSAGGQAAAAAGHAAAGGHAAGQRAPAAAAMAAGPASSPSRLTAGEIGQPLGPRATLVQFSTSFCAPCRATRRVLSEVAGMIDGVEHVEIDAESRLDLVRRLDVRRTPTVLVLGPDGQVAKRASGQPRKTDVIAAIGLVSRG
ncbi:MAG: TlpA family protein disulfide reductase [Streptosporangiaceae bacterium]